MILPCPPSLTNAASIPNRSIQKHGLLRKPFSFTLFPLLLPYQFPINDPLDHITTPLDSILVEPISAIEPQVVNLLPVPGAGGVEVGLHDGPVIAQELEVDLVLRFVAFEGGEVEVEVEAAGVAGWALDEGAEGAVEEAGGGAPLYYSSSLYSHVALPLTTQALLEGWLLIHMLEHLILFLDFVKISLMAGFICGY